MKKAFTLIELLVVVAVIGILSALVLVSLNEAKDRAKAARILVDLKQIKTVAELIKSTYDSYELLCAADYTLNELAPAPYGAQLEKLEDDINAQTDSPFFVAHATTNRYCVSVRAAGSSTDIYCIDSQGRNEKSGYSCTATGPPWFVDYCLALPEVPPP